MLEVFIAERKRGARRRYAAEPANRFLPESRARGVSSNALDVERHSWKGSGKQRNRPGPHQSAAKKLNLASANADRSDVALSHVSATRD